MPRYRASSASADARVARRYRAATSSTDKEILHRYYADSAHEDTLVFEHPAAPTIPSFTVMPGVETAAERTARGVGAQNAIAFDVEPISAASQPTTYNYGTVLTIGESASGHWRRGWNRSGPGARSVPFGSLSVQPTNPTTPGTVDFITYFETTPTQTVGESLNTRFYVRTVNDDYTNPPETFSVNGVDYALTPREDGNGYVSDHVPEAVQWDDNIGETRNIQVQYADGTYAFPNTLSGTIPGTPGTDAVLATVAISTHLEDGIVNNIPVTQGETGSVNVLTPAQDFVATLTATNPNALDKPATRHADYRYNVPASISAFGGSGVIADTAVQFLYRWTFTGSFAAHTISEATVTWGSQVIDLLSHSRHLMNGTAPNWIHTITNTEITRGRTPGTAIPSTATLRVVSRDGTVATRDLSIPIPA